MKKQYCYEYPKADNTVDAVVLSVDGGRRPALEVLLIRRLSPPHQGSWALPGGFVEMDETLDAAVRRELHEETGLKLDRFEQLHTFGDPGRDPRGRVVSTVFTALVDRDCLKPTAGSDADECGWVAVRTVLSGKVAVAFDHREVVAMAVARLRSKLSLQPVGADLLPREFPLERLQAIYETILGRKLDEGRFSKKIMSSGALEPVGTSAPGSLRRVQLYRFNRRRCRALEAPGAGFESWR